MSEGNEPGAPAPGAGGSPAGGRPEFERKDGRGPRRGRGVGIVVAIVAIVAALAGGATWAILANASRSAGGPAPQPGGTAAPTGAAATALTVGLSLEPTNLDIIGQSGVALEQILLDNVYQGLVSVDDDGTIVPSLADSWRVSDDGTSYTFQLHPEVQFHDGAPLSSADVVATYEMVKGDKAAVANPVFADVESITAPDDRTVVITLSHPDADFLWNLAGRAGVVLEKGAKNDRATTANGTGPFLLEAWNQGSSISLSRNEHYWGEAAKVSEVVFRYFGADSNAAANALADGDLDVLAPLDATLAPRFQGDPRFVTGTTGSTDVFTLAYNNAKAPFTDLRVREALSRAIDQNAFIAVLNGGGQQLGGPITEGEPGYENLNSINHYDPDSARQLLQEAGVSGLQLTLTIPNIYESFHIGDVLTTQLAAVGVKLTVNSVDFTTWLQDVYTNKDFDLSVVDHAEAHDFGNYANPGYYWSYDNAQVQSLYAQAMAATDPAKTDELLQQAARIVANDAPAKWLFNYTPLVARKASVSGFPSYGVNSRLNLGQVAVASE